MTNEEKTKELADFLYFKLSHIDYNTLTKKFLEMARWKDEQYKREQLKEISKIEDFARDYASNVADNEKEYFIAKDAVMKAYEFLITKNE